MEHPHVTFIHAYRRVKAKQVAKRKVRVAEAGPDEAGDAAANTGRAIKRRKTDSASTTKPKDASTSKPPATSSTSRPSTQIISSLFSHNPAVNAPTPSSNRLSTGTPSNAPIDSSSFSGLGLDPLLIAHLASKFSIDKPTSIQRAALPALLKPSTSNPRDAFIQSQTGSGKTLSFLLPIIQDLLPLSSLSWIDRSVGTLAIIIAPTRELAKQISDVLELLLKMRLRGADESAEDAAADRRTRWLVSGVLTGGATRTHEKARLRKGLPILVATPGRLLDHLQNTASFDAGKVRWLVLDEADRLMELGFAETLGGILKALDGRRRLAMQAVQEGVSADVGGWDWEVKRRNVLCSATIREDVQKLAGIALSNPVVIKATEKEEELGSALTPLKELDAAEQAEAAKFTPPAQLSQRYVVVPLKLRLVTLVSLLRSLLSQTQAKRGAKVIVFFSCTDSVDFHFRLLAEASMNAEVGATADEGEGSSDDDDEEGGQDPSSSGDKVSSQSVLLPGASVFRLHGSLALSQRMACLKGFASSTSPAPAVLLCTSVASRGLDLPLVRAVVQYDLPTEGGATEYVHRVGRTARAGRGGEAWAIIAPSETAWAPWVAGRMREEAGEVRLQQQGLDAVLKSGFGGKGAEFEARATEVQLAFERWALTNKEVQNFFCGDIETLS
jgi:ATP-dependent RNA helicase DDX31/DBP7